MKVATAGEMREIDRRATEEYGIPSIILMENAGLALLKALEQLVGGLKGGRVCILCGPGNNGGDGFVLARHLIGLGCAVDVFLFGDPAKLRGDALVNHRILLSMQAYAGGLSMRSVPLADSLDPTYSDSGFEEALKFAVALSGAVVDAVFGTGFKGELPLVVKRAWETVSTVIGMSSGPRKPVIAADMPTGIDSDTGSAAEGAFSADVTVTFALPKVGLRTYPGRSRAGRVEVAYIGIPQPLLDHGDIKVNELTAHEASSMLPRRYPTAHKGTYGRVVIAAGSPGLTGAAHLSASAAVRSGAGLVTLCIPQSLNCILEVKTTESMTLPCPEAPGGTFSIKALDTVLGQLRAGTGAFVLGPGLGKGPELPEFVNALATRSPVPVLVDADGLNALDPSVLSTRGEGAPEIVLTPHPGEMARLTGLTIPEVEADRIRLAGRFAESWRVHILLKGASTVIASPDGRVWINHTGNPGMATGGMGDVLSGIIGGLLAQGMAPMEACALGAYVHGRAGDLAVTGWSSVPGKGMVSLAAGDLLASLAGAFAELEDSAGHNTGMRQLGR